MTGAEKAIHDLACEALIFEPEILNDYGEGEYEIKRHDVLEQALIDILHKLPVTRESLRAIERARMG